MVPPPFLLSLLVSFACSGNILAILEQEVELLSPDNSC